MGCCPSAFEIFHENIKISIRKQTNKQLLSYCVIFVTLSTIEVSALLKHCRFHIGNVALSFFNKHSKCNDYSQA